MEFPKIKAEAMTEMQITENNSSDSSPKEDLLVDILECANPGDCGQEKAVSQDVTSSSSSFNDSTCVPDDSGFNDEEAQSKLCQDYPLSSPCDGTDFYDMRKKKLRDDWRRFISPIMWRCRWLELKVKEFQSQARKYNKEIVNYYLTKQFEFGKLKSEENTAKSIPFSVQAPKARVLMRRKRKQVEETTDVESYMSSHNVFSYSENRMAANCSPYHHDLDLCADHKCRSKGNKPEEDCLVPEINFGTDFTVDVLRNIDKAWEKAQKLKRRVNELMCEPSIEVLNHPENDGCSQPQPIQMPEMVAPSQTDMTVQDIAQDLINISPSSFGGGRSVFRMFEDVEEEAGMNNDDIATKEELDYFRKIIDEVTGVPRLPSEEEPDPEDDPAPTTVSSRVNTRKRKRKRRPTWISTTTSARRRAAALRRKTSL